MVALLMRLRLLTLLIIAFYWKSYCLEVYLMYWYAFFSDGTRPSVYEPNGMVSPQMLSVSLEVFVRVEFFHLFCLLFT